jgi:hypothetical protein
MESTKIQEIKSALNIKNKEERIKAIKAWMTINVQASTVGKSNAYTEASVIFDGRLL